MNKELKEALHKRILCAEDWVIKGNYNYSLDYEDSVTKTVLHVGKCFIRLDYYDFKTPAMYLGSGLQLEEDSAALFVECQRVYGEKLRAGKNKAMLDDIYRKLGVNSPEGGSL